MTAGHRHRIVRLKRDGLLWRALTRPTLHVTDARRAQRSRFVYGKVSTELNTYRLSPLGVLHGLIGLSLVPKE